MSEHDRDFMRQALEEADKAARAGEVPVGAVVVHQGRVIARGHNRSIGQQDVTAHAEIEAIRQASRVLGNYRLDECELYVTLEPCVMCSGAIMGARLRRVVFGATEPKTGAAGSVLDVFGEQRLNHHTQVQAGVLADDCSAALQSFFQGRRQAQQAERAGHYLREDALRTPAARMPAWPAGVESGFVAGLPAAAGHRLHVLKAGEGTGPAVLAVHGPGQWSAAYSSQAAVLAAAKWRLFAPDLPGFGFSDKPKKPDAHTLAWHVDVLKALLQAQDLVPAALVAPVSAAPLARALLGSLGSSPAMRLVLVDEPGLTPEVRDAPFPDAGHRMGPKTLERVLEQAANPDPMEFPPLRLHGPDWAAQLIERLQSS